MADEEKHVWVNVWQTCNRCNYATHRCFACGADLDHESYDTQGNHHTAQFCRPDLFEHEVGPLCTRSGLCYWDHTNHVLLDHMEEV